MKKCKKCGHEFAEGSICPECGQDQELELEKTPEMEEIERLMAELDQRVDAKKYKELETKYKKLLSDYTSRRPAPKKVEKPKLRPASEIAKEFQSIEHGSVSNRAYIEKVLEYRNSHLSEFGTDPFTDFGAGGPGEPNAKTEKVAKGLKFLLDTYESDSLFNGQLQEFMKDDLQLLRKLATKK